MTSLSYLVDRASRQFAPRIAVVDGDRTLTFREVGERSNRLANALTGLLPETGSRVAVLMQNRLEIIEVDFAIAKAGKVKAPLSPRLSDEERRFILSNCGASIIFTEAAELDRVMALRPELPGLEHVICVDGPSSSYAEVLANASHRASALDTDPDSPSLILHTSGTTGHPKGATLSANARIAAAMHMLLDEFAATPNDGMLHVGPMSHGSGNKVLAYYARGARNITMAKFDPATFIDAIATKGATSTFLVPTMVRMLLDHAPAGAQIAQGMRGITYGGAPMPAALAEEALSAFGPILTQVYGACEALHPVTVLSREDHLGSVERLSSAGHEATGVEVRLLDERGGETEIGTAGELLIRGPNVMSGYWEDADATAATMLDGWYRTGDVARRDEEGFLYIVGRIGDMLISGGLNVYPAEVESILHRHDGVSQAAVFGTPHERWGEAVTAAVVFRAGESCSVDELVMHCRQHLAAYKTPRYIMILDELPKGTTGKVSKDELQKAFQRQTQSVENNEAS